MLSEVVGEAGEHHGLVPGDVGEGAAVGRDTGDGGQVYWRTEAPLGGVLSGDFAHHLQGPVIGALHQDLGPGEAVLQDPVRLPGAGEPHIGQTVQLAVVVGAEDDQLGPFEHANLELSTSRVEDEVLSSVSLEVKLTGLFSVNDAVSNVPAELDPRQGEVDDGELALESLVGVEMEADLLKRFYSEPKYLSRSRLLQLQDLGVCHGDFLLATSLGGEAELNWKY